jgi:hypothetical protein
MPIVKAAGVSVVGGHDHSQGVAFETPLYRTPAQQNALQASLNNRTFLTPQQASDSWSTYK